MSRSDKGLDYLALLPVVPATEFFDVPESDESVTVSRSSPRSQLSDAELKYLKAVIAKPGQKSSVYPGLAKIASRRGRTIRQRLVALGYIREHAVSTSHQGRTAIVLEPLDAGVHAIHKEATQ